MTVEWNQVYTKALVYQPVQYKNSTVCSQVVTADSEDNLKRGGIRITKHRKQFWTGNATRKF